MVRSTIAVTVAHGSRDLSPNPESAMKLAWDQPLTPPQRAVVNIKYTGEEP